LKYAFILVLVFASTFAHCATSVSGRFLIIPREVIGPSRNYTWQPMGQMVVMAKNKVGHTLATGITDKSGFFYLSLDDRFMASKSLITIEILSKSVMYFPSTGLQHYQVVGKADLSGNRSPYAYSIGWHEIKKGNENLLVESDFFKSFILDFSPLVEAWWLTSDLVEIGNRLKNSKVVGLKNHGAFGGINVTWYPGLTKRIGYDSITKQVFVPHSYIKAKDIINYYYAFALLDNAGIYESCKINHPIHLVWSPKCAYINGTARFFSLGISQSSTTYLFDGSTFGWEHSGSDWHEGESVSGRVTTTLWDLIDQGSEIQDQFQDTPGEMEQSFMNIWSWIVVPKTKSQDSLKSLLGNYVKSLSKEEKDNLLKLLQHNTIL
jgi:hypothetical protein